MIEIIVILPFLSGNILEKHEVDNRAKSEPKETAESFLSFGCSLCLITDFVCLSVLWLVMAAHGCEIAISRKEFYKACIPMTHNSVVS